MLYIFFFENNDFWALETAFCSHWQNRGGEKFGLEATYQVTDCFAQKKLLLFFCQLFT
jgi:hypothetical protein